MELDRTRTVRWADPQSAATSGLLLSGFQYLQEILMGRLPAAPLVRVLGFELEEVGEGRVVFGVSPGEYHYNRIGAVHGGMAAALLDSAMGCAVHSLLPARHRYTTVDLKVNYVRAIRQESGRLHAIGTVIHLGRRIATAEGRIHDASGALYAHALATCLLLGEQAGADEGARGQ